MPPRSSSCGLQLLRLAMNESRLKSAGSIPSDITVPEQPYQQSSPFDTRPGTLAFSEKPETLHLSEKSSIKTLAINVAAIAYDLIIKYWFLLGLAVAIILAWKFPNVARKDGYIHAELTIKCGAVIVIFLISGLSLKTQTLAKTLIRIRLHLLVQVINLVIFPFFVFGLVLFFFKVHAQLNSMLLIGMVIAASAPTTISSNVVMTKNANGNEATALMNAALGNILGIFVSPALVSTFQGPLIEATPEQENPNEIGGHVDFASVLKQLGFTVLAPLIVGQIIQLRSPGKVAVIKAKCRLSDISNIMLLLLVWSVFSDAVHAGSFGAVAPSDIVVVAIINACLYIFFSFLSLFLANIPLPRSVKPPFWVKRLRYSREDTVAVMYCGATKTVAMGVPLINVLFQSGNPGAIGILTTPLLLYHVEQLILGNIEVQLLLRWANNGKQLESAREETMPMPRDEEDVMIDESITGMYPPGIDQDASKTIVYHNYISFTPGMTPGLPPPVDTGLHDRVSKESEHSTELTLSPSDFTIAGDSEIHDKKTCQ